MNFFVNVESRQPLYKQIMADIETAIRNGELKDGDILPSLSELSEIAGISPETAKKAYNTLKKKGILSGKQGKGVYVSVRSGNGAKKILMLFDKLSTYKLAVHRSFLANLKVSAELTINIHNQSVDMLESMLDDAEGQYDYYLVFTNFKPGTPTHQIEKVLSRVPNDKLIILDNDVPGLKGHIGRIYQDFSADAYNALKSSLELIRKYDKVRVIHSGDSLYGDLIYNSLTKLFDSINVDYSKSTCFRSSTMQPGTLFIVLSGQLDTDHFNILRESESRGYQLGKAIGLIIYNSDPASEFISGGLSCLSTDFAAMGRHAAEMISNYKMSSIHNEFSLIRRNSL